MKGKQKAEQNLQEIGTAAKAKKNTRKSNAVTQDSDIPSSPKKPRVSRKPKDPADGTSTTKKTRKSNATADSSTSNQTLTAYGSSNNNSIPSTSQDLEIYLNSLNDESPHEAEYQPYERIGNIHTEEIPGRLASLAPIKQGKRTNSAANNAASVPNLSRILAVSKNLIIKKEEEVKAEEREEERAKEEDFEQKYFLTIGGSVKTAFLPKKRRARPRTPPDIISMDIDANQLNLGLDNDSPKDMLRQGRRPRFNPVQAASGPFSLGATNDADTPSSNGEVTGDGFPRAYVDNKLKEEIENADLIKDVLGKDPWDPIAVFGEEQEIPLFPTDEVLHREVHLGDIGFERIYDKDGNFIEEKQKPLYGLQEADDDLFMIQMPSILPQFYPPRSVKFIQTKNGVDPSSSKKPRTEEPSNIETIDTSDEYPMAEAPEGMIGHIVVYKDSKMKMIMGDLEFDVFPASNIRFLQSAVAIDTEEDKGIYELGHISQQWLVAPNITSMLDSLEDSDVEDVSTTSIEKISLKKVPPKEVDLKRNDQLEADPKGKKSAFHFENNDLIQNTKNRRV
ncbi:hypothetical protein G9A89_001478 [Geosiphon pyriformis]|nr:hypothetical protein G9A89_001478 [Geosiphon pyriformis]